jgi:predicted aspartyl protease
MAHFSFTVSSDGPLRELAFDCHVSKAFDPADPPSHRSFRQYRAIFDTGATNSVISQRVVDGCGLKPLTMVRVHTANGEHLCEVYSVNIELPNRVGFPLVRVTKQTLAPHFDILIGMDIIGSGDFAVTNWNGKTVFSFRHPSIETIDFCLPKP